MIKKLLKILIIIITILINKIIVNAEEDYMLKKYDKVPNVYVTKISSEHQIYDYMYIIARSSDKAFLYCIEPGIHINDNIKYSGKDDIVNSNITKEQYEKIKLISYYGYGYKDDKYNHTDKKWYAATQALIWEVESNNHEIYFTDYLQGPKVEKFINESDEIKNLISKHNIIPNFQSSTYNIDLGDTYTISDINKVLNNYRIILSNDNINVKKNNNSLIITANKIGKTKIKLVKEFNNYNSNPLIYTAENSQTLFKVGNLSPITMSLTINITGEKVIINKVDNDTGKFEQIADSSLIGAEYGLYDLNNNLLERLIINKNGESKSHDILKLNETYYLKEIIPSKGYELDKEKHYFTVSKKETYITLKEKIIKRKVNICKTTSSNGLIESSPEEGIVFNIYLKSSNELFNSITTDENGLASIILPYGTYIFKQQNTTENYGKSNDIEITIDKVDIPIELNITNNLEKTKIKVIKIDSETKKVIPISNIKFKIKNLDTMEYICENDLCEFNTIDGIFITNYIPFGNYELLEISENIEGYQINKTPLQFTINKNSRFIKENNNIIVEITFPNHPAYATIKLKKIDSITKEPIPNTLINVYNSNNDLIISEYTNEQGQIIVPKVKTGNYYYKEVKPSNGYINSNEIKYFSITKNNEIIELVLENKKSEKNVHYEIIKVPNTYKNNYIDIFSIVLFNLGIKFIIRKQKYD